MYRENKFNLKPKSAELYSETILRIQVSRKRLIEMEKDFTKYLTLLETRTNYPKGKIASTQFLIRKIHEIANRRDVMVEITEEDADLHNVISTPVYYVCNPHEIITIDISRFLVRHIQNVYRELAETIKEFAPNQTFYQFRVEQDIHSLEILLDSNGIFNQLR